MRTTPMDESRQGAGKMQAEAMECWTYCLPETPMPDRSGWEVASSFNAEEINNPYYDYIESLKWFIFDNMKTDQKLYFYAHVYPGDSFEVHEQAEC